MFEKFSLTEKIPLIQYMINQPIIAKLVSVVICVLAFYLVSMLLNKIIHDVSVRRALGDMRVLYITRLMKIGIVFFCLVFVCLILGFGYSEISVFLSSIFAVAGIALFAQWSILSNVTASMIIFFGFPYRVHDRIKILDKDDDMTGVIIEISMFHVILQRDDGNIITYPNALILQKAVLKIEHPFIPTTADNGEDVAVTTLPDRQPDLTLRQNNTHR